MVSMSHSPGTEEGVRSLQRAFDEEVDELRQNALYASDIFMSMQEAKEIIVTGANDQDALDGVMRYVE